MFKKRYHVQWENGIWKQWWTERKFIFKSRATKYALRKLARNSNVAAWRIIEEDGKTCRIVFEGYVNRKYRDLKSSNFERFSEEDIKNYYKAPIIISGRKKKGD